MKIILLAGGGGTRLFPLSRARFPKQFLKVTGDESLFAQTVQRFLAVTAASDLVVITNRMHEHLVKAELAASGAAAAHVVLEPEGRNTAPAIAAAALQALAGHFDLIIDTVNVPLDWNGLLAALAPKGKLHVVGAVLEPIAVSVFPLLMGQKSVSGSPTGSRGALDSMLGFAARHGVAPKTEHFPMRQVNEALDHLRAGKARYRIVLDADFG